MSITLSLSLGLALFQTVTPPSKPAVPYWQQSISYRIDASLDEPLGVLQGAERIVYRNRSPDTLTTFALHLYLNAFRPGSRWADADSVEHLRRFNHLPDPDFGFNHVRRVRIMGQAVEPIYPFAPDSTIVRFRLPAPLLPGDSLVAELDWDARPSTVPRRQGRRGRAFDFAQWYPRVVAYDRLGWQEHPLYPAGEFYGDFGDFTVTLNIPADQVVGATGVPLCGDPGWEDANRDPSRPVEYQRDRYQAALAQLRPDACAPKGAGRKTIVWRAEEVHHFALSMRPDYRYEGGRRGSTAVHVLYQPGDEKSWGGGVAVKRTEAALEWLDWLFGPYPWPQITNVHRIENGGTEFPMMIQDGSAHQGLILHELGHNYLMGVLANNEWREGWLDEGFTSFQTTWYYQKQGAPGVQQHLPADIERGEEDPYRELESEVLRSDLDGRSEPPSQASEQFRDFPTYGLMIYLKGELFFHQLREIVGQETMHRILRTYYDRWKLKHVDEAAFRAVAEEVSGRDLSWLFGQWLHSVNLYDYSVGRIRSRKRVGSDGRDEWVTRVEVRREAPGQFPVEVLVRARRDSALTRAQGMTEREWVELVTRGRPREIVVDPRARSHDWNMLNNRRVRRLLGWQRAPARNADLYLDPVFSSRAHRDREALALLPTAWYTDAGGVMAGARLRSNYFGRFDQLLIELNLATEHCCSDRDRAVNLYARLRNPTWLYVPRLSTEFEGFHLEGRSGGGAAFEWQAKGHQTFGPATTFGGSLRWVATDELDFLDRAEWDNGGTFEAELHLRSAERRGRWLVSGTVSAGGGIEYRNQGTGVDTDDRYDAQPYARVWAEARASRPLGDRAGFRIRLFGGAVEASRIPIRQRWFSLAGADPYQRLRNPFIRSKGSLLTEDIHYQQPGGPNVRGLEPNVGVTRVAALNLELDRSLIRPGTRLFQDIRLAGFTDWAWSDRFFSRRGPSDLTGDAGVGLRVSHTIGQTSFVTRFDLPLFVTHPDRSVGSIDHRFGFRWVVGLGNGW